jgi:uncharacterized damage-inducible protein DinB
MHPIFEAYLERLDTLHADIAHAVDGLPQAALDWSPGPEINSIAVLIAHTAGSERFWIGEKAGARAVIRDRASEFQVAGLEATPLLQLLVESETLAHDVLERLTVADLTRPVGTWHTGRAIDVAWALWHALEHVAQHTGHIQVTRQWWEERQANA